MTSDDDKSETRVFISYRRSDTGQVAPRLKKDLVSAISESRIFYDREDLKGGDLWKERLKEAIGKCSVFLALIGKEWLRARNEESGQRRLDEPQDPVRAELELALEVSRSTELLILPVLVNEAKMPETNFLPQSIQGILAHQALRLRTATSAEWDQDLGTLLARMGEKGIVRRAPSEDHRLETLLSAHLQEVAAQFVRHMATSELKPGARPKELYLDLMVVERHRGKAQDTASKPEKTEEEAHSLEKVLESAKSLLLLIGEGGSGKSTSLLYAAARAADRAKTDPTAPVPIFVNLARLTELKDVPDLHQLVADSVPLVKDWNELSELGILERRRILFLFDSFNEMPERLQSNATVVLKRFVEKHMDHTCLIGSRPVPHIEQLARPPSQFRTFEIVRLTSDQVRGFLQDLGLGSLYDRMPSELRGLAGNPFMLQAIARTLAGEPESTLPRNRGKLYERFAGGWMENEERKRSRSLEYSYERVKEPLLAYLAKRMTSAGQTSLTWADNTEQEVETQLVEIDQRIKRRGGMPDGWTVDRCLDEILGDGLLKRVNEQLHFMHQSLQEYFTAVYFRHTFPDALVDFTPRLLWELVPTYALTEVPNHRFVSPVLMTTGLLDDSTKIVEALAVRNPILAAAAISSASRMDDSLLARLEQSWLDLLEHDDLRHRIVGCSCAALAATRSPRVIQRLVAFALGPDSNNRSVGILALGSLGLPDAVAVELIEQVLNLPGHEYEEKKYYIERCLNEVKNVPMVSMFFRHWQASPPDSSARHRLQGLLESVDESVLSEELQRYRTSASDPATADDAERAFPKRVTFGERLARNLLAAERQEVRRMAETVHTMSNMGDQELAAALRSKDPVVRAAAAKVAADRHVPLGDVLLESLVQVDQGRRGTELISALVSLWGEGTAVSKLVEQSRKRCCCLGTLTPELATQLAVGELSGSAKAEIERLGVRSENLKVEGSKVDGSTSIWILSPSSWSAFRLVYQLRVSPGCLEFYDCNVAARAYRVLAQIPGEASLTELRRAINHDDPDVRVIAIGAVAKRPGEASLTELQRAIDHDDPDIREIAIGFVAKRPGEASLTELQRAIDHDDPYVQKVAIDALAERGDQGLAARLLARLHSVASVPFIYAALNALAVLRDREALTLMSDLLVTTDAELSDAHPVWGPSPSTSWGDAIHRILVSLKADSDIQLALEQALTSDDPTPKVAALKEFSRWFEEVYLGPDRNATWRTPERLQRLLGLALRGSTKSVRTAAVGALGKIKSEGVQTSLADALTDNAAEVRVAAGEALVRTEAQELYGRVAKAMLQLTKADQVQDLRRRAGKVLSVIPDGVEPLYRPIQEELRRGGWHRALEMVEATLEIIPEDVNLFWWRGHALRQLGQLDRAADSFQRASELEEWASVIPQALAQTFLQLGDFPRAMETARRGAEIDPGNAEAQSTLAWSSYKAGAIPEAVRAATKAVNLDPVHGDAIWIVLLGHLRQANCGESRSAFQHAMRVRQLLSPGVDTSFVTSCVKELEGIKTDNADISGIVEEIRNLLHSEVQGQGREVGRKDSNMQNEQPGNGHDGERS